MKAKKIITAIIISLLLVILGTTNSHATLELKNLDFDVQINENGSMDVVETWDIDIEDTNTLYKTFEVDSSKYEGLENVHVKEITNGREKTFTKTSTWQYHLPKDYYFGGINENREYEISWGVDVTSSATRQYEIRYTILDAVKKYGDCSELYWKFIGDNFEIDARKVTGRIKFPELAQNKEDIKVWGHTKYLNGEINVIDPGTIEFKLDKYRAKNFVEVRIAIPDYMMQNLEYTSYEKKLDKIINEETIWANEANEKRAARDKTAKIIAGIVTGVLGILGVYFLFKIKKYIRELKEKPKILPEIELEYYRELPDETASPLEASFILNKSQNTAQTISALILNLTLKGYLKAEQVDKKISFEILNKDTSSLAKEEKLVLELLEKSYEKANKTEQKTDTKIVTMKDVEKYIQKRPSEFEKLQNNFEKIAKDEVEEKGKFSKEIEKKSVEYIGKTVGYIMLIIFMAMAMLINSVVLAEEFVATNMVKYIIISGIFSILVTVINLILTSIIVSRLDGFTRKRCN